MSVPRCGRYPHQRPPMQPFRANKQAVMFKISQRRTIQPIERRLLSQQLK